jgi:hypothetical protein
MHRLRRLVAVGAIGALSITGGGVLGACSDDDNDGNPEVDVPEDVDVDVDRGKDNQGD